MPKRSGLNQNFDLIIVRLKRIALRLKKFCRSPESAVLGIREQNRIILEDEQAIINILKDLLKIKFDRRQGDYPPSCLTAF
jgi:hypothetical protein